MFDIEFNPLLPLLSSSLQRSFYTFLLTQIMVQQLLHLVLSCPRSCMNHMAEAQAEISPGFLQSAHLPVETSLSIPGRCSKIL